MMAACTPTMNRRASANMYDPARDIYTVSDESSPADRSVKAHGPDGHPERPEEGNSFTCESQERTSRIHGQGPSLSLTTTPPPSAPDATFESGRKPEGSFSRVDSSNTVKDKLLSPSSPLVMGGSIERVGGDPKASRWRESVERSPRSSISAPQSSKSPTAKTHRTQNVTNLGLASANNGDTVLLDGRQKGNQTVSGKKRKLPGSEPPTEIPKPVPDQPGPKRKRQEERFQKARRRGKPAPSAYSRRDRSPTPPRSQAHSSHSPERQTPELRRRDLIPRRSRSPSPIGRSPSPDSSTLVRKRKRPGEGARIGTADKEAIRRRQEERERQQKEEAEQVLRDRGVHDVVRQHYNAVPERGREWRKTESRIKGLRSFNNWIKSTIIQKFSPDEDFLTLSRGKDWHATDMPANDEQKNLLVLDLGCGKGGDLGKWQLAPQRVELYVGLDPAEISIEQARERYHAMRSARGRGHRGHRLFHAEFFPKDCFGEWLGDVPIIQRVGIDGSVGPGGSLMSSRWGGGGFDIVVSMFSMHYAFENEQKARQMLRNVAGSLKKGGRFLGVGPNSDVLSAKVVEFHQKRRAREAAAKQTEGEREDGEVEDVLDTPEWGNSIYRVRFPGETPEDGIFRPAFGWKYSYFMEEAVEEIPEYVVPWEAFRALTQDYNLELQYRKPFLDIWQEEKDGPILGPLSERMGVRARGGGPLLVSEEELDAASFYHAFCFYKV